MAIEVEQPESLEDGGGLYLKRQAPTTLLLPPLMRIRPITMGRCFPPLSLHCQYWMEPTEIRKKRVSI